MYSQKDGREIYSEVNTLIILDFFFEFSYISLTDTFWIVFALLDFVHFPDVFNLGGSTTKLLNHFLLFFGHFGRRSRFEALVKRGLEASF